MKAFLKSYPQPVFAAVGPGADASAATVAGAADPAAAPAPAPAPKFSTTGAVDDLLNQLNDRLAAVEAHPAVTAPSDYDKFTGGISRLFKHVFGYEL